MPIYDGQGNEIVVGGGGESIIPYNPGEEAGQSTLAGYGYNTFIDSTYEPLRAANPNYISREAIGTDASGQYTLWLYTFEPDYPEQTIWIHSGVHGREKDAYIALYLLMRHIINDWRTHEGLAYLRWHCRICIIPIMNPWGCVNNKDANYNDINLNRDNVDESQPETIANHTAFEALMAAHGINFALDFHTTVNNSYGDYMIGIRYAEPNLNLTQSLTAALARINARLRTPQYLAQYNLEPDEIRLVEMGGGTGPGVTYAGWWWAEKAVPSATIEHSDYVWSTSLHTAAAMTRAVEVQMNQLMAHALAKFPAVHPAEEEAEVEE